MKIFTQIHFFDEIISYLNLHKNSINSFKLIFCLIWAYEKFRTERPVYSDVSFIEFSSSFESIDLEVSEGIHVFPSGDLEINPITKNYNSRFYLKQKKSIQASTSKGHLIIRDQIKRLKNFKQSQGKNNSVLILKKPFIGFFYLTLSLFKIIVSFTLNLSFVLKTFFYTRPYIYYAFFKSLILFYSNYFFFDNFFKKNKHLSYVLLSNYYSPSNLGLILAANNIKLKTIDIQHGVQSNVIAYERIDFFPNSIRPSKLYLWPKKKNKESKIKFEDLANFKKSHFKCLITLQPSNSDFFLQDIKLLSSLNFEIRIRMHPRRSGKEFENILKSFISNSITIANQSSLNEELNECDLHLSEYSSSLIESSSKNILSIALNDLAKEYMGSHISDGSIIQFSSIEDFIKHVKTL